MADDNPFSSIPADGGNADSNPFAAIPATTGSNPFASAPAQPPQQSWLQTGLQAAERYPQGIMKTAEDFQTGVNPFATQNGAAGPNILYNFFGLTQDSRDATQIAQTMGERIMPAPVIANPNSHFDYLATEAGQFVKELPFTTMGVASEFANPTNAFLAGAIKYMPNVHINAPQWVDNAVDGVINFAGGPFSALNDSLKSKLSDHLADVIHDKLQSAPGWMDQLKSNYKDIFGKEATDNDIRDSIKAKIDRAVEDKNAGDIAQQIIAQKLKGPLPGLMQAPKELAPPGSPIMADQYAATPNSPLQEGPVSDFAPATVDSAGSKQTSQPVSPLDGQQRMQHLTSVQMALDTIQDHEASKAQQFASNGIPVPAPNIPQAQQLDKVTQERLIQISQKELLKPEGNDQSVQKAILNELHRNEDGSLKDDTARNVSAETMNENKEEAGKTPVFDWRTLSHMTISEMGQQIKNENVQRQAEGQPLIVPGDDLTVHRHVYQGQPKGVEQKVRDAILLAYNRAKAPMLPPKAPTQVNPFDQIPPNPPPAPFDPGNYLAAPEPTPSANPFVDQAIKNAQDNLSGAPSLDNTQNSHPTLNVSNHILTTSNAVKSPLDEHNNADLNTKLQEIERKLPKAEHIAHDIDQIQAHVARNVVKELGDVERLLDIVRSLGPKLQGLPFDEAQEQIAQAAGLTVSKVKSLLKQSINNDVRNTEATLQNAGVAYRQDTEEHLREAMQLLQDWDESRSNRNLPQPKVLEKASTKDLREKGIDGDSSKESKTWMSPDETVNRPTIDHLGLTREGTTNQEVDAARRLFDKQGRASTNKMKAAVIAHHGVYDKLYIDEIQALVESLPESGSARKTIENAMDAIKTLTSNGTKELNGHRVYKTLVDTGHIKFAMSTLRDAVREAEQVTARAKQKLEEASGYENLTKEEVDAAASEHPSDQEAKEPTDPSEHGSEVTFDNDMDVEEKPFAEDGEDLMYMADPLKMMKDAFNPPMKIRQWGDEPRECAAPSVLSFLRRFPMIAKLDDWFTFKTGGEMAMTKKALELKMRFSSGEAKDAVQGFAMYEQATDGIIRSELQPLYNDMEKSIKEFLNGKNHPDGLKANPDSLHQAVNRYSRLLAHASEQVMVRGSDPHNYAYSELGHGPHKDVFEKDAYVKAMKDWYNYFQIPFNKADEIRWNTQRTPDIWNLLKNPKVMNSDKLQRIVLFYKAQIEMPMLMEQVKNGIFSNADIWKSIVEGYHMKNFALKGEQSDIAGNIKNFFMPKSPLGAVKMPTAKYSSQQAFESAGATDSWSPISDFFSDNAEYMKRAMLSVKQAQLLKEISKLPLPKLEFFSDNYVKALAEHPIPENMTSQLLKVHSSTDKVIVDIAKHMTDVMFTPAEIAKGLDIERQTGKNPYSVSPMTVLAEGGWIQSHQDDGLNKWYRGSFSPPFVYKTLYDMIQTVFRTSTGFDTLPGIAQLYMAGKQAMLIDPLVHVPQYIGNTIVNMPVRSVPAAMLGLPIKSTAAFFKGLAKTGPDILAGKYTHDVGMTADERQWARAFTEHGSTMVGGYNVFLHNMIGKADKGMFPQRQEFGDNLRDYLLSGFGTGPSVLGEMVGQHALRVMIEMTKEYVAQGMDPQSAIKATVYRTNTSMNNLNQVSWQGSRLGAVLSLATFSKNFAVGATRMMMMASQSPIGGAVMGGLAGGAVGGLVGAAVGGAAGARIAANGRIGYRTGSGARNNVFTGADIPEQFRDQLNSDMLKGVSMMLFWTAMFYGVTQLALYHMQKDEEKNPGEEYWWNNPVPMVGSVNLFMKNVNNQPMYMTYNQFRLGRDIADQLAPLVNAAGKNITGNKDFDVGGKGPVKYTTDKFGASLSYIEAMVNSKFLTDNSKIWDTDEKNQWKMAAEGATYIAGKQVPINPFVGGSTMKTPLTDDKFVNMLLESATLYGVQYKAGVPAGGNVEEGQAQQWRKDVGHEDYVAKNGNNPFSNFNGGRNLNSPEAVLDARQRGEITQKQYINFFKKENPSNYFKQNRKKINAAEAENNDESSSANPFDSVENPENQ